MEENLLSYFNKSKYLSIKYKNYFPIYENIFKEYKNKKIIFVEIGVFSGGSLFMWREFFGKKARIIGVDLNEDALRFKNYGFEIFIGNQSSIDFWNDFFNKVGPVDIILDDGGHTNYQQIITATCCIPNIKDGGILAVEDVYHSYIKKKNYNPSKYSFINFCKKIVDDINFRFPSYISVKKFLFSLNRFVYSLEFFEAFVVFKINKELCDKKNAAISNNGIDISSKDLTHIHDTNIPGSNKFILKIKKFFKFFRGNFQYLVFKLNEIELKKYFK
jgi:hypothetical protein